ncbi:membrane protein insertase YidC [Cognatiluteimonas weifangensis]|uniref:Membrane protein insertase YidC n=1 Tax=Cognatiluteimonas weifangensis TaxID=2303539 RepID=A0A372DPH5_9GAMM|nr:membrane protein insertase YidC [Luteimonas weifangensis]RFP61429.1 membrane protein insertase YidC [Luteimonas weifangensis]
MNQTRTFLIFAWLAVATLLFLAWTQERAAPPPATPGTTAPVAVVDSGDSTVPAIASAPLPQTPTARMTAAPAAAATESAQQAPAITVVTDVLQVRLDGGAIRQADLPGYPQTTAPGSAPMRLFAEDPAHFFQAQSGWVSSSGPAPSHEAGFIPVLAARTLRLAAGADTLEVPFLWQGPDGVSIRRSYVFTRGDYAVQVRDEVVNAGSRPWQGHIYRQLLRVPPVVKTGFTRPESYSFHGAAWFTPQDKFEKRKFADYLEDGPLDKQVTGGWIAMLQHHFFAAWIPGAEDASVFSLAAPRGAGERQLALIRELGPGVAVAPGARAVTSARLWVGPKLVKRIEAQQVPGLERAVDFSSYSVMAWLAGLLFAVLAFLHGIFGNWGWAIVGLVLVIKLLMYPLSAAQYKSAAKMRRFQPRIEQLKERYGDDKQKFQLAMMELYKKEKINPVGGCLPVLVQMPVFLALYWTLLESVELRQAPWIGWIHNLTAPDPYFILPAINIAVMWATQKLTPTPIADPMQRKMMQYMPVAMGVMFAFFPAGLVLYWVTNGSLGLLQQWWMLRKYGEAPAKPAKAG